MDASRLLLAGFAAAVGPALVLAAVRVLMRLVAIARTAAQVRTPVVALLIAGILGVITRVVAPSV